MAMPIAAAPLIAAAVLGALAMGPPKPIAVPGAAPGAALHLAQLTAAERAVELQRLHEELNSDNPFLRRAAFEIAMESADDLVQRLAIDAAMGGNDPDLQADALRAWLGRNERLSLDLQLPDRPTDAQRAFFDSSEPAWFTVAQVSPTFLRLNWRGSVSRNYDGGFVPGGLRVEAGDCRLDLRVVGRRELAGTLSCGADRSLLALASLH
jgi:hypothetical protein